jgi:hypothetical protein
MIKKALLISFMVAAANTQAETVLYGDGQARRYQRDREISAIEAIGQAMQEQEVERNRAAENIHKRRVSIPSPYGMRSLSLT